MWSLASGGYYKPGELYYWHLFDSHASAMGANSYNKTVMGELKKLPVDRVVNRSDVYAVVMPSEGSYKRGDTFANWNVVVLHVRASAPQPMALVISALRATPTKQGLKLEI